MSIMGNINHTYSTGRKYFLHQFNLVSGKLCGKNISKDIKISFSKMTSLFQMCVHTDTRHTALNIDRYSYPFISWITTYYSDNTHTLGFKTTMEVC